jgi:hypothetical protein
MVVRGVPARRQARCLAGVIALLACLLVADPANAAWVSPIGVHSMLYVTDPFGAEQAMFQQAAQLGASTIRLDIELSAVFSTPNGPPDWTGVDQYMTLARQYHLRVLADLLATPSYLADCPAGTLFANTYQCPPFDPAAWGKLAGQIAAHTRGVINEFEIINEPDGGTSFTGTPQQYAQVLSASYAAIHAANPHAKVALGGLMNISPTGQQWINQVFNTPGADAIDKFDIANLHIRTNPTTAAAVVAGWKRYYAREGFHGPLWVTETGYPADPADQTEPGYQNGPGSQARWMTTAIPAMLNAGAAMVFVTERDTLTGPYASEGILQTQDPLPANPQITRRPSYYAIQALTQRLARTATRVHGRSARTRTSPSNERGKRTFRGSRWG